MLTILSEKFKYILNSKYHVEFSGYLSTKSGEHKFQSNDCDFRIFLEKRLHLFQENSTYCINELISYCNGSGNVTTFESLCNFNETAENTYNRLEILKTEIDDRFNKQFAFSEYFNLFDFITSMWRMDDKNQTDTQRKFDFIVLDFHSIFNELNESIIIWRPRLILQQNELHQNQFIMHHALTEDWISGPASKLWECGAFCWGVMAAAVLAVVFVIIITSLSAGIAIRYVENFPHFIPSLKGGNLKINFHS